MHPRWLWVLFLLVPSIGFGQSSALHPATDSEIVQAVAHEKNSVVLVDFWATWCGPCREELPKLVKLERDLHDQGLRLIIVSMDEPKQAKAAVQFLDSIGARLPQYIRAQHTTDSAWVATIDPTWDGGLPGLFLYGRSGERLMRFRGERVDMEQIKRVISKVLQLPPAPVLTQDSAHAHGSR